MAGFSGLIVVPGCLRPAASALCSSQSCWRPLVRSAFLVVPSGGVVFDVPSGVEMRADYARPKPHATVGRPRPDQFAEPAGAHHCILSCPSRALPEGIKWSSPDNSDWRNI